MTAEIQELSLYQKSSSAKFYTLYIYRRWQLTPAGKIGKTTTTTTRIRKQEKMVLGCLAVWLAGCHLPAQPLLALPHTWHNSRRRERRKTTTTATPTHPTPLSMKKRNNGPIWKRRNNDWIRKATTSLRQTPHSRTTTDMKQYRAKVTTTATWIPSPCAQSRA